MKRWLLLFFCVRTVFACADGCLECNTFKRNIAQKRDAITDYKKRLSLGFKLAGAAQSLVVGALTYKGINNWLHAAKPASSLVGAARKRSIVSLLRNLGSKVVDCFRRRLNRTRLGRVAFAIGTGTIAGAAFYKLLSATNNFGFYNFIKRKSSINDLKRELEDLKNDEEIHIMARARNTSHQNDERIHELNDQGAALRQRNGELENRLYRLQHDNRDLADRLDAQGQMDAREHAQFQAQRNQLRDQQARIHDLEGQIRELQIQRAQLDERINELNQHEVERGQLRDQNANLARERGQLQEENVQLQREQAQLRDKSSTLEGQLRMLELDSSILTQKVNEHLLNLTPEKLNQSLAFNLTSAMERGKPEWIPQIIAASLRELPIQLHNANDQNSDGQSEYCFLTQILWVLCSERQVRFYGHRNLKTKHEKIF